MAAEYEFRLAGRIDPGALAGFDGMSVVPSASDTVMRGRLAGQSAVFAILARLHSLGLTLLELRRTDLPGSGGKPPVSSVDGFAAPLASAGARGAASAQGAASTPPAGPPPAGPALPGGLQRPASSPRAASPPVSASPPTPADEEPAIGSAGDTATLVELPAGVALMVGLMGGLTEGAVAVSRRGLRAAESLQPALGLLQRLPGGERAWSVLRARADSLSRQGSAEFASGLASAQKVWSSALNRVGEDPAVARMVNELVDRVLGPVVDKALPMVLDRLASDPKYVRQILGVQSFGMAEEVAGTIRERTAAADDQVERIAHRLLRRRNRQGVGTTPPLPHEA